jgi:hypothetical protein
MGWSSCADLLLVGLLRKVERLRVEGKDGGYGT